MENGSRDDLQSASNVLAKYAEGGLLSRPLQKRIEDLLRRYIQSFQGRLEDMFVSEYMLDGSPEYESVWFFSRQECAVVMDFVKSDAFDIVRIERTVTYLHVEPRAYDFGIPVGSSRLQVFFKTDNGFAGTLKASGANCEYLRDVMAKYLRPNMRQMAQAV